MENVEIRNIKILKKGFIKMDLAFNTTEFGIIVVKGFRVGPSIDFTGLWVQVPSYQLYGRYQKLFFMENTEAWKELEEMLTESYAKETENPIKTIPSSEDIDFEKLMSGSI